MAPPESRGVDPNAVIRKLAGKNADLVTQLAMYEVENEALHQEIARMQTAGQQPDSPT